MCIDDFHDACEEWDEETLTTEDLKAIAFLTTPSVILDDVLTHIDALDMGAQ